MVGASILSKIIQCKRNILRKKQNRSSVDIKKEPCSSKRQCRICLNYQGIIPIYGGINKDNLSEVINLFGGIDVHINDEYPKHLCSSCYSLLQNALLFRSTAQNTDKILKQSTVEINMNDYENYDNYDDGMPTDLGEDNKLNFYDYRENATKCETAETGDIKLIYEPDKELKNEKFKCEKCNEMIASADLRFHMKTHAERISYMCDICGKRIPTKTHFVIHYKTHFYELPHKCSECPYRGRTLHNLQSHTRKHTGEKPYECQHCPSKFGHVSNLKKHLLTHKTEKDFKCDTCGKGYHTKKLLDDHFKVDHANIREHVCNICGKAFGYRKKMMQHTRLVHKRQRLQSGRLPLYLRAEFKES